MEPFSIALGALQVTGATIKISSLVYTKLKTFRHYSRETGRLLKAVDRQRGNFLHEIRLLLRQAGENEEDLEAMLLESEHPRWKGKDLNIGFHKALGTGWRFKTCMGIIKDIGATLKSLQADLCCFDVFNDKCSKANARQKLRSIPMKNEPLKEAIRRLRNRVKITLDMSKFEGQIKMLRDSNDDLRRLRKQLAEIKKPTARGNLTSATPVVQLSQEFGSILKVRRTSKALHQALAAAWLRSVENTTDETIRHDVKVFLDAPAGLEEQIELAISCYALQQPPQHISDPSRCHQSLRVESQEVDFMTSSLGSPPASSASADSQSQDSRRKRRKGCVDAENKQDDEESHTIDESTILTDLRNVENICAVICHEAPSSQTSKCLGYLDGLANEAFRHTFFQSARRETSHQSSIKLSDLLHERVETSINFVEQLKLARNLVLAVLKFHSTPWLREHYFRDDLSFFRPDGVFRDNSSVLQTAHLSLDFVHSRQHESCNIQMENLEAKGEALDNAQLIRGVRNPTLWSLGAMLLEIGTWSRIGRLYDVDKVRRLAQAPSPFGRRYGYLTKQCLECDFGYGVDLSKPRLQQAVYQNVVGGLTDMIRSLDISDD